MAQGVRLERDSFCCPVCLELLNDPVTIPCGHSCCMSCMKDYFDNESHGKLFSCPLCRQTFTPRPLLVRNAMLALVVEELKKTSSQGPPAGHCYAGPGDLACDLCKEEKLKAVKFCLQCLASFCEKHLRPHYDVGPFRTHKLVEASAKRKESICPEHQEVMKLFCRTDQRCICYLCSKDHHKGHDKVSAAAERNARQRELDLTRQNIQQRFQDKENDARLTQQEEDAVNHSASKALTHTEKLVNQMTRLIDRRACEVKSRIQSQQDAELRRLKKHREAVEQEVAELRRKDAELEELSRTDDHTYFLLNYFASSRLSLSKEPPGIQVCRRQDFEKVTVALSEARDKLREALGEALPGAAVPSDSQAEPRARADFLRYACHITLDPNTANPHLSLSQDNRRATFVREEQEGGGHPDRFEFSWQVLSREALTGRCYWEVERSGSGVLVALAYKGIGRTGNFNECVFGLNDKSWALDCFKNSYEFRHNSRKTAIPGAWSSRIGVYLDHSAGIVSFYSVSDTMTLLQRVKTTFSEPLYAGVWLSEGAAAEICRLR